MIDAKTVKELREITGAGMMDCKKALVECDGDMDKAIDYLKEKGMSKAAKKTSRIAAEGVVEAYVSNCGKKAVVLEVNSETDFVSKNEEFKNFVAQLAQIISKTNPKDVQDLLQKEYQDGVTVEQELTNKIATIGENMNIRRFERFETDSNVLASYVHGDGKIAVIIEMTGDDKELAKDLAMQIAALNAQYIKAEDIPAEVLDKEREILSAQLDNEGAEGKKREMQLEGRMRKRVFSEYALEFQPFVKDPSRLVKDVLEQKGVEIVRFARFEKGEGLEKKVDNFAEEVMSQLNN